MSDPEQKNPVAPINGKAGAMEELHTPPMRLQFGPSHPATHGTVKITLDHGRLMWTFNSFSAPLEHYQNDTFTLALNVFGRPLVRFTPGADGSMEGLHVGGKMDVDFHRPGRAGK